MKTLQRILYLFLLTLAIVACERDYDMPPLNEPKYEGADANITIAALKKDYAAATQDNPITIEEELVVKAIVSANDESGNIFKQIFVQDSTGGIPISVDQNSVYTTYRVGQEVFVDLKGMCVSAYGGQLQLGYPGAYLYRTPWEDFVAHVFLNGWPDETKLVPVQANDISKLNEHVERLTYTLVQLNGVSFTNGGKGTFAPTTGYGTQVLKDAQGNAIDVRTSNYADFASDKLPEGTGTITGILGRFNDSWQLTVRTRDDIGSFEGEGQQPPVGEETVIFMETFGEGYYPSGNRPKIADFTDFDMKSPITYSDASGNADIRSMSGGTGAHVWFPANQDAYLTISGINTTGHQRIVLSYEVAANLYSAGEAMDLNAMTVKCNGTALDVPSIPVSNANGDNGKFYSIEIDNLPIAENVTIEFFASAGQNTLGLRLDNIKLTADPQEGGGGDGPIVPDPLKK